MFRESFEKSLLKRNTIKEKQCLKCFTTIQLEELLQDFRHTRRYHLQIYLECLEQQYSAFSSAEDSFNQDELKNIIWKSYRHYDELVQWVEHALKRRRRWFDHWL
jgi:hypothetical protein